MAIFNSYVSLPEGKSIIVVLYSSPVPQSPATSSSPAFPQPRHDRRNWPCGLKGLESASEIHLGRRMAALGFRTWDFWMRNPTWFVGRDQTNQAFDIWVNWEWNMVTLCNFAIENLSIADWWLSHPSGKKKTSMQLQSSSQAGFFNWQKLPSGTVT